MTQVVITFIQNTVKDEPLHSQILSTCSAVILSEKKKDREKKRKKEKKERKKKKIERKIPSKRLSPRPSKACAGFTASPLPLPS